MPDQPVTTAQLDWLRARLPASIEGRAPRADLGAAHPPARQQRPPRDILVCGKRKPYLNCEAEAARIARHIDEFWSTVRHFLANPDDEPD